MDDKFDDYGELLRGAKPIKGSKDNMEEVYDRIAEKAGITFASTSDLSKNQHLLEFLEQLPLKSNVLDVGPGKGAESKIVVTKGHKVSGLDISQEMLKVYAENVPGSETILGSMTNIPLEDEKFEGLISACSLLHLNRENGLNALNEFKRVLKNQGLLFLATSVGDGKEELNENESLQEMGIQTWYFYHWLEEDLKDVLAKIGFNIKLWDKEELVQGRPKVAFILAQKP